MAEISFDQFLRELSRMSDKAADALEIGTNEVAEDLLSVAQKLAPLDEGGLMESGSVEPAKNENGTITARIGFSKEYALRRHEDFYNLGETSSKKPGVDGMKVGRKYLEQPTFKNSEKYVDYLGSKLEGVLDD